MYTRTYNKNSTMPIRRAKATNLGHTHSKTLIALILFLCCPVASLHAQRFAVKTNLLYGATLTPNLGFEVPAGSKHWTLGVNAGYRPWPTDEQTTRKYRHLLISPYARLWTDSIYKHSFFGIHAVYSHYNVGNITFPLGFYKEARDHRMQGDLAALGLSYGYNWPLSARWHLEAELGAALAFTKYDKYECRHCGAKLATEKKFFLLPKLALNVVYNIGPRPKPVVEEPVELIPVQVDTVSAESEETLFVFEPKLSEVPDFRGRAGILQTDNPVLAHISEYRPYDRTRILRKEKGMLYVHFDLNKYNLRENFRDNGATLQRIIDITKQIMADSTSDVKKIQIVGLASIEGSVKANETLSRNRANALQQYIQQRVPSNDSLYETVGGGEAWAEFRDQLNDIVTGNDQSSALHAQLKQALDIIDTEADLNQRERKLKRMNGGRTWQYIKQNILADQRNSGYLRIYYDYVPDTVAAVINKASKLLLTDCSDCHRQALQHLLTVSGDPRAHNALGVALYLCGRPEEALPYFRSAAANGNEDAKNNLEQIEKNVK